MTTKISGASIPSIDPDLLIVVTDKDHVLYDVRVELPIDEALVKSIIVHGVIEPVKVRRDGETLEVVDGRQRTRACREANKRLKKEGSVPHTIRYLVQRGNDAKVLGIMASTFIRQEDSPIGRAYKMQKHVELGRTEEDIAIDFGVDTQTVRNTIALLDCAEPVQQAVEAGKLPAAVARKLADLPRVEQTKALDTMKAEGATKGKRAHAAADRATNREPKGDAGALGKRAIQGIVKRLKERSIDMGLVPSEFAVVVLEYVIGASPDFAADFPWQATGQEEAAE